MGEVPVTGQSAGQLPQQLGAARRADRVGGQGIALPPEKSPHPGLGQGGPQLGRPVEVHQVPMAVGALLQHQQADALGGQPGVPAGYGGVKSRPVPVFVPEQVGRFQPRQHGGALLDHNGLEVPLHKRTSL